MIALLMYHVHSKHCLVKKGLKMIQTCITVNQEIYGSSILV